jgi:hypothetical protein
MNFKQYIKILEQNTVGKHNDFATSSFLQSSWTGSESAPDLRLPFLPSLDLEIPQVTRSSIVSNIILNKNPIIIELQDGTRLFLSLDEYNRIQNKPAIGKNITVVFQRNETDKSENSSKIIKIEVN